MDVELEKHILEKKILTSKEIGSQTVSWLGSLVLKTLDLMNISVGGKVQWGRTWFQNEENKIHPVQDTKDT